MTQYVLIAHSILRWVVLLIALSVTGNMLWRYAKAAPWTGADRGAARLFTTTLDIQFLLGIVVYAVSPITREAMGHMADAMKSPSVRFFVAEHPMIMLVSLGLAHAGSSIARKAPTDRLKFLRAGGFFTLATALMLWGIPWWRLAAKA
jgi:hypothetical protein